MPWSMSYTCGWIPASGCSLACAPNQYKMRAVNAGVSSLDSNVIATCYGELSKSSKKQQLAAIFLLR